MKQDEYGKIMEVVYMIDMNYKKVFRDVYLDGRYEEYEMTFKELLEACGLDDALAYWRGENPYERL